MNVLYDRGGLLIAFYKGGTWADAIGGFLWVLLWLAVTVWVFHRCWNRAVTPTLNLPPISQIEALQLVLVAWIVFGTWSL